MITVPLTVATASKRATLNSLARLIGAGRISVSAAAKAYQRFRQAQMLRGAVPLAVHPEYLEFFVDEVNCGTVTELCGAVVRNGSTWNTNQYSGEIK